YWRNGTPRCARSGWSTAPTRCTNGAWAATSSGRSANTARRRWPPAAICCRSQPSFRGARKRDRRASTGLMVVPGASAALPLHRLPRGGAAAKAVGPVDASPRLVGAALPPRPTLAEGADIEHAPAIGDNAAALHRRAGVKNLDALDLGGLLQPFDD